MESKQTAVEWLIHQLITENEVTLKGENYKLFEIAKEMEKEQIIDAYDEGKSDGYKTAREWDEMVIFLNAEQYYNDTYESE